MNLKLFTKRNTNKRNCKRCHQSFIQSKARNITVDIYLISRRGANHFLKCCTRVMKRNTNKRNCLKDTKEVIKALYNQKQVILPKIPNLEARCKSLSEIVYEISCKTIGFLRFLITRLHFSSKCTRFLNSDSPLA